MQRKKFPDNDLFSKFGDLKNTIISFGKKPRISTDKSCLSVCTQQLKIDKNCKILSFNTKKMQEPSNFCNNFQGPLTFVIHP